MGSTAAARPGRHQPRGSHPYPHGPGGRPDRPGLLVAARPCRHLPPGARSSRRRPTLAGAGRWPSTRPPTAPTTPPSPPAGATSPWILRDLGRAAAAQPLLERALAITEATCTALTTVLSRLTDNVVTPSCIRPQLPPQPVLGAARSARTLGAHSLRLRRPKNKDEPPAGVLGSGMPTTQLTLDPGQEPRRNLARRSRSWVRTRLHRSAGRRRRDASRMARYAWGHGLSEMAQPSATALPACWAGGAAFFGGGLRGRLRRLCCC